MDSTAINTEVTKPKGRQGFAPGRSGNPSGRPKRDKHVAELARTYTVEAINALAKILKKPDATDGAVIAAAEALLNRGWGRAPQSVELSGPGGGPIAVAELGQVERRQLMLELQARLLEASVVLAEEMPPAPAADLDAGQLAQAEPAEPAPEPTKPQRIKRYEVKAKPALERKIR